MTLDNFVRHVLFKLPLKFLVYNSKFIFFLKGIKKITRLLDSAKSVEMLTCCKGDSSEKIKSLNGLYTSKGDEQITYSTTNLAAIN